MSVMRTPGSPEVPDWKYPALFEDGVPALRILIIAAWTVAAGVAVAGWIAIFWFVSWLVF